MSKLIKCYTCECGEDVYEDDDYCVSCQSAIDPSKFKYEAVADIISQSGVEIIVEGLLRPNRKRLDRDD